MTKKLVALATLAASLSFGAGGLIPSTAPSEKPSGKKLWWASVAAVAAASVLDARSSWGRRELNPLLQGANGRFSSHSIEIKSVLVGAGVAFQWFALRHHNKAEKSFSIMNLAVAGATTGVAIRNSR